MRLRLTRWILCGSLVAHWGCQNTLSRPAHLGDKDSLETRFSISSDDPAALESGRGHLPSLASELADRRPESPDEGAGIPGGSSLTVKRLLERGHDADAHGRAQEARMYYEQVLAEKPSHPEAHHRLAILADQAGDYASAENHYQMALRSNPNDADVLNDLGYSYFLQGRAADSERYLSQALQIQPRHPHVQENLSLLYDQAKAEKVLMSLMGPRQTQATLAQLFQNAPSETAVPHRMAQRSPDRQMPPADQGSTSSYGDQPEGLEELQRKMEEARLQSIAERKQRHSPQQPPALPNRLANTQPRPHHSPPQTSSQGLGPGVEIPAGHINDVFRRIDAGGHSQGSPRANAELVANRSSQVPGPDLDPRMTNRRPFPPAHSPRPVPEQRAAAPQWNTLPQWPEAPQEALPPQTIEHASYTQPANPPAPGGVIRSAQPSAAERAAVIGMSTGPGAMFPQWNSEIEETEPQPGPVPAVRSLPGTHSRMNGTMYPQPGGSGVPANWDSAYPAPVITPNGGQPTTQFDSRPNQPGFHPAHAGQSHSAPQANPPAHQYAADAYDQMRSAHNRQFNQDQEYLAADPNLMSNGQPAREALPGRFDSHQQDWPAYTREQYDTRQIDQPSAEPQPPLTGQGQYEGTSLPQYNPATQPAPQNYGRRW